MNIGLADETVKRQARDMEKAIGNDMISVNKVSNRKFDRKRVVTRKNENLCCQRCGKSQGPKKCPAWQKPCSSCGKMNNFQLMCKSKKRADGKFTHKPKPAENRRDHVKKVDESHQSSSDDEYVNKIQSEDVLKAVNAVNEKTLVKTTLNDVKVMFSVDSGSCINLLDEVRFKEIQSGQRVRLN